MGFYRAAGSTLALCTRVDSEIQGGRELKYLHIPAIWKFLAAELITRERPDPLRPFLLEDCSQNVLKCFSLWALKPKESIHQDEVKVSRSVFRLANLRAHSHLRLHFEPTMSFTTCRK